MPRSISRRAQRIWDRLLTWYGARMADQFGKNPPADWAELFDRTDDSRLEEAVLAMRRASPSHPPTLGDLEAAIPTKRPSTERSVSEQLTAHASATLRLCPHQLIASWNYFGDIAAGVIKGVQIPACAVCGSPSHRVRDMDLPSTRAA